MEVDIENEKYHADTSRIGKSGLDLINRSPAHYWAQYLDPNRVRKEPTPTQITGTIIHTAILEFDEFLKRYFLLDDAKIVREIGGGNPRATKKYKEWKSEQLQENEGRQQISKDDYEIAMRSRDAVLAHGAASELITDGIAEDRIDFTEPETGVKCKIKPDWRRNDEIIVDVKSTLDASPYGFAKSIANYRYDVQAALYSDGLEYGLGANCEGFIFVAVEKEPPFAVGCYYIQPEMIQLAREKYLRNLETYKKCLETGIWPAYGQGIQLIELPGWAKKL